QISCLTCRQASLRAGDRLVDDRLGLARIALEPVGQPLVRLGLYERLRLAVAQLLLRLPLELRLGQLDRDDRREPLANVVTGEVGVLLLEQLLVAGVSVDHPGQRRAEALLVRTS